MIYIIRALMRLFLLKGSPEELPHSKVLLVLFITVDLLTGVALSKIIAGIPIKQPDLQLKIISLTTFDFFIVAFVKLIVLFACIYGLLAYFKITERFIQTTSAIIGVNIILTIFLLINIFLIQLTGIAFILFFLLIYWNFMVYTYVFVKSFSTGILKAGVFALLYMLVQHNVGNIMLRSLMEV